MKTLHALTAEWKRSSRPLKIAITLAPLPLLWWTTTTLTNTDHTTRSLVFLTLIIIGVISSAAAYIQSRIKYRRSIRKLREDQARWAALAEQYRAKQTNHNTNNKPRT